jgi:DNA-binding response OmpR family regulator
MFMNPTGISINPATHASTIAGTLRRRRLAPAHGAEKALEMAYRDLPALALIDIDLGGTIDGISVAAELAPLGVAVVFITADYKRAAVEGREFAADILIKPVTESTVLRSITAILQRKQAADTGRAALSA